MFEFIERHSHQHFDPSWITSSFRHLLLPNWLTLALFRWNFRNATLILSSPVYLSQFLFRWETSSGHEMLLSVAHMTHIFHHCEIYARINFLMNLMICSLQHCSFSTAFTSEHIAPNSFIMQFFVCNVQCDVFHNEVLSLFYCQLHIQHQYLLESSTGTLKSVETHLRCADRIEFCYMLVDADFLPYWVEEYGLPNRERVRFIFPLYIVNMERGTLTSMPTCNVWELPGSFFFIFSRDYFPAFYFIFNSLFHFIIRYIKMQQKVSSTIYNANLT